MSVNCAVHAYSIHLVTRLRFSLKLLSGKKTVITKNRKSYVLLLSSVLYVPFRYGQISHESFGVPDTRNRFPDSISFASNSTVLIRFVPGQKRRNRTMFFSAGNSAIKCMHTIAHTSIFLGRRGCDNNNVL